MVRAAVLAVGCIASAAAFAPALSASGSVRPLSGHTALKASVATESGRWQPPMGYVPPRLSKAKEVGESRGIDNLEHHGKIAPVAMTKLESQAEGATAQALSKLETMALESKKSAVVNRAVLQRTLTIRTPWGALLLLLKRQPDFPSAQEVEEKVHSVGLFKLAVQALASLPGNMVKQVLQPFPLRVSAVDATSAATTAVTIPGVQLYWGQSSLGSARQLVRGVISPMANLPREVVKQVLRPLPLNFSPVAALIAGNLVNRAKMMERKVLRPPKVSPTGDEDYLSSLSLSTNTKKRWKTPQGGYVPTSKRQKDWSYA